MGRPLNKKYFGNRNIGTTSTITDDGIGGRGLAAWTLPGQLGVVTITDTYKYFPTLTIPNPDEPEGVQATVRVVWELNAVSVSSAGSGYTINQTAAPVTSLSGSIWTGASVQPGLTINTNGTGNVSAINIVTRGEWTSIDGTGITTWAVVGAGGSNAQITATFRLKSITTVEKGSGYITAPGFTTSSWARASSQSAGGQTQTGAPSVVLTTNVDANSEIQSNTVGVNDSSDTRPAVNQTGYTETAIVIYAYIPGGSSGVLSDIIKQEGQHRYKVQNAQGSGYVNLVVNRANAVALQQGEAFIQAFDSDNGTYFVSKITAHKATVYQNSGSQFESGSAVPWNFNAAQANVSVSIDNTK
jgi:hypothetical protein